MGCSNHSGGGGRSSGLSRTDEVLSMVESAGDIKRDAGGTVCAAVERDAGGAVCVGGTWRRSFIPK